jgi:hypothetical protein
VLSANPRVSAVAAGAAGAGVGVGVGVGFGCGFGVGVGFGFGFGLGFDGRASPERRLDAGTTDTWTTTRLTGCVATGRAAPAGRGVADATRCTER